jgi:Tfp pilus assembly protein PilO
VRGQASEDMMKRAVLCVLCLCACAVVGWWTRSEGHIAAIAKTLKQERQRKRTYTAAPPCARRKPVSMYIFALELV